jgi:hypothetical protein
VRRPSLGAPIVSDDEVFRRMRTATVCGRSMTVLAVPPFANHYLHG